MSDKIIRAGMYYYTLSTTESIRPGDWYMSTLGESKPIQSKEGSHHPEWGDSMLKDGIYLKITHTSNPNINFPL